MMEVAFPMRSSSFNPLSRVFLHLRAAVNAIFSDTMRNEFKSTFFVYLREIGMLLSLMMLMLM